MKKTIIFLLAVILACGSLFMFAGCVNLNEKISFYNYDVKWSDGFNEIAKETAKQSGKVKAAVFAKDFDDLQAVYDKYDLEKYDGRIIDDGSADALRMEFDGNKMSRAEFNLLKKIARNSDVKEVVVFHDRLKLENPGGTVDSDIEFTVLQTSDITNNPAESQAAIHAGAFGDGEFTDIAEIDESFFETNTLIKVTVGIFPSDGYSASVKALKLSNNRLTVVVNSLQLDADGADSVLNSKQIILKVTKASVKNITALDVDVREMKEYID